MRNHVKNHREQGSRRVRRLRARQEQAQPEVSKKAAGYVRVSTEEQAASGFGLEAQENAIRAFAKSQGYEWVETVRDAGVSGSTRPEDRPGFRRLIELAESRAFSVLLVWKFDRLARSLLYAVTTVNMLREKFGVVLRSVTEPIDTASPMGEVVFAVLAGMAAQERRSITERTLAGKREKAKHGGFAGGPVPYGYRRNEEGGLAVDPEEAEVVRRIYGMRRKGQSFQAIADALNADGVPTRRGRKWHNNTIQHILDNPKYQGYVEYYFRWEGDNYILKPGQHEAIVPKAA